MPREDSCANEDVGAGSAIVAKAKRRKAFRFLPSSDVLLLKEVVKHTPWSVGHGEAQAAWEQVASGVKAALPACTADGKACRRRFSALHDAFRREEMESLRASGTTEEYTEREQLLTDLIELEKVDKSDKEKRDAEMREAATVEVVRDAMAGSRNSRSSSPGDEQQASTTPSKRSKRSHTERISDYLEWKVAERRNRAEERQQQLALEERYLELDERRLDQDRDRQEQDIDRNDKFLAMMASQMHTMTRLIETITNAKLPAE